MFKQAALQAKQQGQTDTAREYLRWGATLDTKHCSDQWAQYAAYKITLYTVQHQTVASPPQTSPVLQQVDRGEPGRAAGGHGHAARAATDAGSGSTDLSRLLSLDSKI